MYPRHAVTLAPSFGLFVTWLLMGILKEEWEFHNTEGFDGGVHPLSFYF